MEHVKHRIDDLLEKCWAWNFQAILPLNAWEENIHQFKSSDPSEAHLRWLIQSIALIGLPEYYDTAVENVIKVIVDLIEEWLLLFAVFLVEITLFVVELADQFFKKTESIRQVIHIVTTLAARLDQITKDWPFRYRPYDQVIVFDPREVNFEVVVFAIRM